MSAHVRRGPPPCPGRAGRARAGALRRARGRRPGRRRRRLGDRARLWADGATPISTLLAESGARALREGLDAGDHERLLYGAALAGWTFSLVGGALQHRICHLLGGAFDLPHAQTHSAVLSHVAALNAPAAPEASARLAAALGAEDLAGGIHDLERRVGAPTGLRELGLPEERLDEVVSEVAAAGSPVPLDERAARELLKRAWAG